MRDGIAIRHLPPVAIEGHRSSGMGGPDHPMRIATRRAGLQPEGWTAELRREVAEFFDGIASDWHTRSSPERMAVVLDALSRGVDSTEVPVGTAVEVGSGIGAYSRLLAERFETVVAIDLSRSMLSLAPVAPAHRVQADGARLPLRDGSAAAIVLINAFLFPDEVERVLSPNGVLVWVNTSGEQTPIYLSVDDLVARLTGEWTGTTSEAGEGYWCVLRRVGSRRVSSRQADSRPSAEGRGR
jgi:ubiquinone/menaquinone biosynthesis C-methylase UbiE